MRRRMLVVGMVGMMAVLLAALPYSADARASMAQVRLIHAAPLTEAVDVFLDGQQILTGVKFMDASSYLDLAPGSHEVALAPTTQGIDQAILTSSIAVEADQAYTVAAVGLNDVSTETYVDDLSAPPAGKARLRVIHTSPDGVAADVQVVDGPTLISNLAFPEASDYVTVDAGIYNLQAVSVGSNTVVIQLPDTPIEAGKIYTALVSGRLASIQAKVFSYTPEAASAGTQPASPSQQMPATGIEDYHQVLLLGLGALLLCGGFVLRRRRVSMS